MDYIICVRRIKDGEFDPEPARPGAVKFLSVPQATNDTHPSQAINPANWTKSVLKEAEHESVRQDNAPCGDIVFFVHGFNTPTDTVLRRHRKIKTRLVREGFQGVVVSYDWPSNDMALNYLEDRWDAKSSAILLVKEGIRRFTKAQRPDCHINLHILAHSMGSFVVREAFDDADDVANIAASNWSVSQVLILSGDISSGSMTHRNPKSSSLYRHCVRLTNYNNPFDEILKLSNVKRIGVSPRLGRVGLPDAIPAKAVNVNCGDYYKDNIDTFRGLRFPSHNWYFDDQIFFRDVMYTISGDRDRAVIETRNGEGSTLTLGAMKD